MSQSLLSPWTVDPPLDGVTPVFEAMGVDPSIAPGVDRPPGSVAYFGGNWYWKFGKLATDWLINPFNSGGGGTSPAAAWSLAVVRYFLVDYDNGNDASPGFIDAAAGTVFTGGQVAAAAIKTIEQLYALVPPVGNARSAVVLIRNRAAGANYLDKDGVTQSSVDTTRFVGYRTFIVRGSTDLTNSTTDRVRCGFFTALAGPNGDGSFTVDVSPTTTTVPVVGGGLTVDAGVQFRLRVVTGVRAGQVRVVTANSATTFTLGTATTGGAVVAGDTVIIERPGVRVDKILWTGRTNQPGSMTTGAPATLVGIAATTTVNFGVSLHVWRDNISGIELTGVTANSTLQVRNTSRCQIDSSYTDETGAGQQTGMGLRTSGGSFWTAEGGQWACRAIGFMNVLASHDLRGGHGGDFGDRSYVKALSFAVKGIDNGYSENTGSSEFVFVLGNSAAGNAKMRVLGPGSAIPVTFYGGPTSMWRVDFQDFAGTTHGPLYFKHMVGGAGTIDGCSSSGTLGPYALDISESEGLHIAFGKSTPNTLQGSTGDVRMAGGAFMAADTFTKSNIVDIAGNDVQGTAGAVVGQCVLATVSDSDGVSIGSPVKLNPIAAGNIDQSDWTLLANAQAVGIAVMTALQGTLAYYTTTGTPYVNTSGGTVVFGGVAYVGPLTGGVGVVTATQPPSGTFQLRLGRFISGTGGLSGHIVLNPEIVPIAVP